MARKRERVLSYEALCPKYPEHGPMLLLRSGSLYCPHHEHADDALAEKKFLRSIKPSDPIKGLLR